MPDTEALRTHMQQLAAITAIFDVEYGEPQFTFDPCWAQHEQLSTNKNGCGDELFLHFCRQGCFIKGFAHESSMAPFHRADRSIWPRVLDQVPVEFTSSLTEPAFDIDSTTFAIWRLGTENQWSIGDIDFPTDDYKDGSADLLKPISFSVSDLAGWLSENYETDVDSDIIQSVFDGRRLSNAQMSKLNPSSPIHTIRDAVSATGWEIETVV